MRRSAPLATVGVLALLAAAFAALAGILTASGQGTPRTAARTQEPGR